MTADLLYDAVISGILLGLFYASISIGLSIAFGLVDVPHIAYPTFLVLGGYGTYVLNTYGWDPILSGVVLMPLFFFVGMGVYQFYYLSFEKHGSDTGLRGLAFFFGLAFALEALLIMIFGIDQRGVGAPYIGGGLSIVGTRVPVRMLVTAGLGLAITAVVALYISRTFTGRALQAIAQDPDAMVLVGANPVKIKRIGFGIATAIAAIAGALLIILGPLEPATGRIYIGKTFAIVVLAGLGSIPGTFIAALVLGLAESIVLGSGASSWTNAVSFTLLLLVLTIRPNGFFGK